MTIAEKLIERLKISRAFDKIDGDKIKGFETIARHSGVDIEDLKKWYGQDKIDSRFFESRYLAEDNLS